MANVGEPTKPSSVVSYDQASLVNRFYCTECAGISSSLLSRLVYVDTSYVVRNKLFDGRSISENILNFPQTPYTSFRPDITSSYQVCPKKNNKVLGVSCLFQSFVLHLSLVQKEVLGL